MRRAVILVASVLAVAATADASPYLSQAAATNAATRDARAFQTYFNSTHSISLYGARAYCSRQSATTFTCAEGFYVRDYSGDNVVAVTPVRVTLVNGRTTVKLAGRTCVSDSTTGVQSSGCP